MSRDWRPQALTCFAWEFHAPVTCRVCGRLILKGDYQWSFRWDANALTSGHACAACGWYRLEDFNVEELRALSDIAVAWRDRKHIDRAAFNVLSHTYILTTTVNGTQYGWTECGKILRDKLLRRSLDADHFSPPVGVETSGKGPIE